MSTNMHNPADRRVYPDRWPRYRGKRLFEVIDDKSENGEEELLSVSHITGITPRSQKTVNMFQSESLVGYKRVQVGDIAANTMWTWQGAIGVSEYAGVVSPAYNVYRQRDDFYNPKFLDLLLREPNLVDVYRTLSTGIQPSRLRLYPNVFLSIDFPLPPRNEQDLIIGFLEQKLGTIDRLIAAKRREIVELRNIIASVLEKELNHCSITDCVRLKQLGYFFKGGSFSKECLVDEGGLPAILYGDIYTQYEYVTNDVAHQIDAHSYKESPKVSKGDIVMTGTGETKEEIGKPILYVGEQSVAIGGDVIAFRPCSGNNERYLLYSLYSRDALYHRYINGKGDIIVHIYPTTLGNTLIKLPNILDQERIVATMNETIRVVSSAIQKIEDVVEALAELRKRIVSDVVTGKVDAVTDSGLDYSTRCLEPIVKD